MRHREAMRHRENREAMRHRENREAKRHRENREAKSTVRPRGTVRPRAP